MPIDHDQIRYRIRTAIEANRELSVRNVSIKAIGSDSALHKFLTSQNASIKIDNVASVADTIGVSLGWLLFGESDKPTLPTEDDLRAAFLEALPDMPKGRLDRRARWLAGYVAERLRLPRSLPATDGDGDEASTPGEVVRAP